MGTRRLRLLKLSLVAVVGGVLFGFVTSGTGVASDTEERPAWLLADGTIDAALWPDEGLPVIGLQGELECRISLDDYLNAGGLMVVDIVTEQATPADGVEADASSSRTDLDEQLIDSHPIEPVPALTLCD